MSVTYVLRIVTYLIAPLLAGALHVRLDKSVDSAVRRWEIMLLYLFSLGVGISGVSNWIGHVFMSDLVAEAIGWPTGSPFQLEMGFANLALGVLGIGAVVRRDGFREATVAAVTVVSLGATLVHLFDIIASGNLAPGNTIQNFANLLKPALLIGFLTALRRAERRATSAEDATTLDRWRGPRIGVAWWFGSTIATGFSAGFFAGQEILGTALGLVAGLGIVAWRVRG